MKTAEQCLSMADVRDGIDSLDTEIVALLAQRTRFIEAAARIKQSRDAIHDTARIDDVLAKVAAHAGRLGVPLPLAEATYRALIAASIDHEYAQFDRMQRPA